MVPMTRIRLWWCGLDHTFLALATGLSLFGLVSVTAASFSLADRLGFESFYFAYRQGTVWLMAACVALMVSMTPRAWLRAGAAGALAVVFVLLLWVLVDGVLINGARRWLAIGQFVFQPSEIVKPLAVIVSAWLLHRARQEQRASLFVWSGVLFFVLWVVVTWQPDVGQGALLLMVWAVQCYVVGIHRRILMMMVASFVGAAFFAYVFFPHVAVRVDGFLFAGGDAYQIERSLAAFAQGGLFGQGVGQGVVKTSLPDAHSDFIFAVIGEEWGLLGCMAVMLALVAMVALGAWRLPRDASLWVILSVLGLGSLLLFQSFIHMASTLGMIPTKGMTLPFISYGGSSLLGIGVLTGLWLALTRRDGRVAYRGHPS
ncbi:MAG: FtsW/RodA/SpoVE family cell cycle protein [Alphaproteobacteria bacterium GM202ARS2]|nr:FtsW/RodA/SpoVE family cell cycle protein [Alphaproteobacteria bacterium GM202ARS2]